MIFFFLPLVDGEARVEEKDGTGETGLVRQESDGLTEARQDGDGEQAGGKRDNYEMIKELKGSPDDS